MPFEEKREALTNSLQSKGKHIIRIKPLRRTVLSSISATSSLSPPPSADLVHSANDTSSSLQASLSLTAPSDWTVESLVTSSSNFIQVPRVSASLSPTVLLTKVLEHEKTGVPLIIDGWHHRPDWDNELFSMEGFVGDRTQIVDVRNIRTSMDIKMPLGELAHHYEALMKINQYKDPCYYGKDIPCPEKWEEWLRSNVPSHFHPCGVNDMISCLPPKDRVETLMCYMGIGDTFTPAHKDSCGSFGHNLMCHTTDGGSAFWFISATGPLQKDEPATYFHDKLGVELDLENHRATVEEFRAAPFRVYVAEQRLGDLVLVPPRSCHQVVNKGGITIKMSWSRMGLESFQYSLRAELAIYHRVCRPETYRVKLTVFFAVKEYTRRLIDMNPSASAFSEVTTTLTRLLCFLNDILVEEWSPEHETLKHLPVSRAHELHSCDFCGADIFQSFFACSKCSDGDYGSEFICCPACYIEGRSCICGAGRMEPHQSWPFDDLLVEQNAAADALNKYRPPGKRIPRFNTSTMQSSSHLQIFYAACMLQDRILRQTDNRYVAGTRCTTCSENLPSQYTGWSLFLHCRVCDSDMCFLHIMEMHNVHVAEALLASAHDADPAVWHTMHTSNPGKHDVSLDEDRRQQGEAQSLAERMAWAAATFKSCRPLDLKLRAKKGFYDKLEPGEFSTVVQSGQMRSTTKRGPKATTSMVTLRKASTMIVSESPLTELSELPSEKITEDESDQSKDDSDDDFVPVRQKQASPKKRVSELAIEPVDQVPLVDDTRPNRCSVPYVLVPPRGEKRMLVSNAGVSPEPSKRVKLDKYGPPRQKKPKPLESLSRTLECGPTGKRNTPTSATITVTPAVRARTVVPVGLSAHIKGPPDRVPGQPSASAQEPKPNRYGKPPRSAKRKAALPSQVVCNSVSRVSTAVQASSTSSSQTAGASSVPDSINPTQANLLQMERDRSTELQILYDKSLLSESTLRLQVAAMTADSNRRARDTHAETSRLTKQLSEAQGEICRLTEHLERCQASIAGMNSNLGYAHMAGTPTGSTIARTPVSPSRDVHLQRAGPRPSSYDRPDAATRSTQNHQPYSRPTGYPSWQARGRGSDRRSVTPAHIQHHRGSHSFNAPRDRGRNYGPYRTQSPQRSARSFHQSDHRHTCDRDYRGGDWQAGTSPKGIIYERDEGPSSGRYREPEWHHTEDHGAENGRREHRQEWYGAGNESPRRGRYGGYRREGYIAERECGYDSQRGRFDGSSPSGDERRGIAVRSPRTFSPVSYRVPDRNGDMEEVPDHSEAARHYYDDRGMQRSSLDDSRLTRQARSGSPPPRQRDSTHPRSIEGESGRVDDERT